MKAFRVNAPESGFTLIELMIAMLIGVFLMAGVIQIFLSAKQAYRLQENLSRLQENGRFAMDVITKDIRMAGYAGCGSKVLTPNSILKPERIIPALTSGLIGVDRINVTTSGWNGVANRAACGTNQCVAGTDVISILSANSCGTKLKNDIVGNAALAANFDITTPNSCGFEQTDVAIIASCTHTDIFAITNNQGVGSLPGNGTQNIAHANNLNCVPRLGYKCEDPPNVDRSIEVAYHTNDTEILAPRFYSYYIRTGTGGVPALWQVNNAKLFDESNPEKHSIELVEGIEDMWILYGVDTDTTPDFIPNYYVNATQVTDWAKVISVRVSLLVATLDDNLTDEPQPYSYNSPTKIIPTDRRLRRVFSSTIAVRNRLP